MKAKKYKLQDYIADTLRKRREVRERRINVLCDQINLAWMKLQNSIAKHSP